MQWIKKGRVFIMFLEKEAKAQWVFKRGLHTNKVGHKTGICQFCTHFSKFTKIISRNQITQSTVPTGKILGVIMHGLKYYHYTWH